MVKSVSSEGEQKRKRIRRGKASRPETTQDQNIPRAEATDAFFVSSAMWPARARVSSRYWIEGRPQRTGGVEASQDARGREVHEHEVPDVGRAGAVVVLGEDPLGALEAVRLADADGEPDDGEEEIDGDDECRGLEDPGEAARREEV